LRKAASPGNRQMWGRKFVTIWLYGLNVVSATGHSDGYSMTYMMCNKPLHGIMKNMDIQ
jgi:hypothetical protein